MEEVPALKLGATAREALGTKEVWILIGFFFFILLLSYFIPMLYA
jgi:hypothetical protein